VNYELFIARRIIFRNASKHASVRPILRIALTGVALGFSVMLVAIAVVSGFKHEISEKVIGFGSHIQVSNFDENNSYETQPISSDQSFIQQLKLDPEIKHIQVFATKAGILKTTEGIQGVVMKGIDKDFDWSFFRQRIVEGSVFKVQDSVKTNDIIVSRKIATLLRLKTGQEIVIYFIQDPPRGRKFRITGIYETGLEEFDNLYLLCDIGHIQKLNDWTPKQVGGFEISLRHFDRLDEMGSKVYEMAGSTLNARTIREIYPQLFDWLGLQDLNALVIIILMIIVAGINMISALLIVILDRIHLIGTLKALGSTSGNLRKIFLYLSSFLIVRGLMIGNLIGIGLCLLQKYTHLVHLDQQSYYIPFVPVQISIWYILILNAGTLLICTLLMLLPTILLYRISPLKALRFS